MLSDLHCLLENTIHWSNSLRKKLRSSLAQNLTLTTSLRQVFVCLYRVKVILIYSQLDRQLAVCAVEATLSRIIADLAQFSIAVAPQEDKNPPGVTLIPDFISEDEEQHLLNMLANEASWETMRHRRVAHWGHGFEYEDFSTSMANLPLPAWLNSLPSRILPHAQHTDTEIANQLTVNEYQPGHGIPPHVDNPDVFGDTIWIVSLQSGICMEFAPLGDEGEVECERKSTPPNFGRNAGLSTQGRHPVQNGAKCQIWLPPRSLLVVEKEARYDWTHAIPNRRTDCVNGEIRQRSVRTSFTFRYVSSS